MGSRRNPPQKADTATNAEASATEFNDAIQALLAYRHGDKTHLTQDHARVLYAVFLGQTP